MVYRQRSPCNTNAEVRITYFDVETVMARLATSGTGETRLISCLSGRYPICNDSGGSVALSGFGDDVSPAQYTPDKEVSKSTPASDAVLTSASCVGAF